MTFEEYVQRQLGEAGYSFEDMEHREFGSCPEFPDSSDHVADAGEMVQARAQKAIVTEVERWKAVAHDQSETISELQTLVHYQRQASAAVPEASDTEAFEMWATDTGRDWDITANIRGEYISAVTSGAWEALQARAKSDGGPLEIWLGNGDKIIADIYAEDGSHAGVGIFEPENGETNGIGEPASQLDGRALGELNALVLIQSTRVESLQVLIDEIEEAIDHMGGSRSHAQSDGGEFKHCACLFRADGTLEKECIYHQSPNLGGAVPVIAWMHDDPNRVDVIHNKVKDFIVKASPLNHRPMDKAEHYTIPLYAAPQQPAQGQWISNKLSPLSQEHSGKTVVIRLKDASKGISHTDDSIDKDYTVDISWIRSREDKAVSSTGEYTDDEIESWAEIPSAAPQQPAQGHGAKRCTWGRDTSCDPDDSNDWASGCGAEFSFIEGGPVANGFHYCPNCGRNLSQAPDQPARSE